MARYGQAGFESFSLEGLDTYSGIGSTDPTPTISYKYTGNVGLAFTAVTHPAGFDHQDAEQIQAGAYLYYTTTATLFTLVRNDAALVQVRILAGNLEIVVGGTVEASMSRDTAGLPINAWRHIGLSADATDGSGWVSVYVGGTRVLRYTGSPAGSGATPSFTGTYFGGNNANMYVDDVWVDTFSSASGPGDQPPNTITFVPYLPTGDGTLSQWTPVGDTLNHDCVDDPYSHDADVTHVYATSPSLYDLYTLTGVAIPTGKDIQAVTFFSFAKTAGDTGGGGGGDDWWETPTTANPICVYQPKGAASYADSKTDLSGNGNDATEGTAPGWNATDGWIFDGVDDALNTGMQTDGTWTFLMQFTDYVSNFRETGSDHVAMSPNWYISMYASHGDGNKNAGSAYENGNMAMAQERIFKDGTWVYDLSSTAAQAEDFWLGGEGNIQWAEFKLQAFAIYDGKLTDLEVATVAAAMAAL